MKENSKGKTRTKLNTNYLKTYEQIVHSNKYRSLTPVAQSYEELMKNIKDNPDVYREENAPVKALTGEKAAKMYSIPPWPPNYTNLEAFKSLLLQRRALIARAGSWYVKGSTEEGPEEATDTPDAMEMETGDSQRDEVSGEVEQKTATSAAISSEEDPTLQIIPLDNNLPPALNEIQNQTDNLTDAATCSETAGERDFLPDTLLESATSRESNDVSESATTVQLADGTEVAVTVVNIDAQSHALTPVGDLGSASVFELQPSSGAMQPVSAEVEEEVGDLFFQMDSPVCNQDSWTSVPFECSNSCRIMTSLHSLFDRKTKTRKIFVTALRVLWHETTKAVHWTNL